MWCKGWVQSSSASSLQHTCELFGTLSLWLLCLVAGQGEVGM